MVDTPRPPSVRVRTATEPRAAPASRGVEHAHRRAQARARSLAYGRRRAARRVAAGRFVPHPGWRHRVPDGRVVVTDQALALARVEALVDVELWREDRRVVVLAVLRGLVCGMDWTSGLVAGVTRAHLAAGAGCSVRTVSRVIAWAVEAEVLVVVEAGASAEFLGTEHNRAPSYVVTAPIVWENNDSTPPVEQLGNPPACGGWGSSPRRDHGQERLDEPRSWPVRDRAGTPRERAAAAATLLARLGAGSGVVRWRAAALLGPWFAAGWCVAGLLWALERHPDRPDTARGDAVRGARDPLAVIAARLRPWVGRAGDLPSDRVGVDPGARRAARAALDAALDRDDTDPAGAEAGRGHRVTSSAGARAAARAELGRVLTRSRHRPR